ncbi:MAG: hypothetical protein WD317_01770, partial [Balneolaceae bacterium]
MFSLLLLLYLNPATEQEDPEFVPVSIEHLVEIPPVQAEDDYGFLKGDYEIDSNRIKRNESLYLILRRYDI